MIRWRTNVGLVSWQGVADRRSHHAHCQLTCHSRLPPSLKQGARRRPEAPAHAQARLDCLPGQINASELTIETLFRMRRRGVELKLHLGDLPPEIDETLVRNIAKGRRWLAMIVDGRSFSAIADSEKVSTRRVQDVANLALASPDILDAITLGEQPGGLTTNYLIKTSFSAVWSEQSAQFAAL